MKDALTIKLVLEILKKASTNRKFEAKPEPVLEQIDYSCINTVFDAVGHHILTGRKYSDVLFCYYFSIVLKQSIKVWETAPKGFKVFERPGYGECYYPNTSCSGGIINICYLAYNTSYRNGAWSVDSDDLNSKNHFVYMDMLNGPMGRGKFFA